MAKFTFKKAFAFAAALLLGLSAAQAVPGVAPNGWTCEPPTGVVDAEEYPAGLNSFELLGSLYVNYTSDACVKLYRNDQLIREIPANNKADVYTWIEMEKNPKDPATGELIAANIHVTFWGYAKGEAANGGDYTVVIEPGFFRYMKDGEMVNNEELTFNFKVAYKVSDYCTISPKPGQLSSMKDFYLTFPEGTEITFTNGTHTNTDEDTGESVTTTNFTLENKGNGDYFDLTPSVEGNVMTLSLPNELTTIGNYVLSVATGSVTIKIDGVTTTYTDAKDGGLNWKYSILPLTAVPSILPIEGQYFNIQTQVVKTKNNNTNIDGNALFEMELGAPYTYLMPSRPYWVKLDDKGNEITDSKKYLMVAPYYEKNGEIYWDGIATQGELIKTKFWICFEPNSGENVLNPAPGIYQLVLPANIFQMNGVGLNPICRYTFTILDDITFPYTLNPIDGSTIRELEYIRITFDEGRQVNLAANALATVTNGIKVYKLAGKVDSELLNEVTFRFNSPITEAGEWQFSTPTSGFTVDDRSPMVSATFNVDPTLEIPEYTWTFDPAENVAVKSIKTITITFPGYTQVTREGLAEEPVTFTNGDTSYEIDSFYMGEEPGTFIFELKDEITESGSYLLTIPRQTLYVYSEEANIGFYAEAIKGHFVVDSSIKDDPVPPIQGAVAEIDLGATVTVYNAAGVCLLENADAAALETLEPGFYIVNGKKLVLTK